MIIKTKEFKEVASAILLAVSDNAANLELVVKDGNLRLNVTDKEYYVSKIFQLENPEDLRAVVNAKTLLDLVSGITTETFDLSTKDTNVIIKVGKSRYKVPMVYENDSLMALSPIVVNNATVHMGIKNDILQSILNVNSKELTKVKNVDVSELQKLYYIDETGCFTFTTGATLNKFTLEKPIKLLLIDKVVKLFKLFKEDVTFLYGIDALVDGTTQTKVAFINADTYVAAIVNCDDLLINKVQGPCKATKDYIEEKYSNEVVVSTADLAAAVNRLLTYTKNVVMVTNNKYIPATVTSDGTDLIITDSLDNTDYVAIKNNSYVDTSYSMMINLVDLKLVLDSCKMSDITINYGNHRSIVVKRGEISNLIPESRRA